MNMPEQYSKNVLSVIMPAFNEEATIVDITERVLAVDGILELIIVDDCSSDGTAEIVKQLCEADSRVRYEKLSSNQGKTAAIRHGISLSRGEIVIIQDSDLEYDPTEISEVIGPILNGFADVVYGSRFMVKKATRVLYFWHYLANKGLTLVSNCLTNLNMTDIETCYKAFRGDIIRSMVITSTRFGFEVEATAKIAKIGCTIYEVPISYYGRTYAEGKKIGFRDGVAALWFLVKYNLLVGRSRSFSSEPESLSGNSKKQQLTSEG
jgi:Glycosyltransferases involved in cell wall biogenesis